jgi:hypothetical protein
MVQYAVTLKDGDWTVFKDGEPFASNLSRSAAVEMAEGLAFEAEEAGQTVELLIQGYTGELGRKVSGGAALRGARADSPPKRAAEDGPAATPRRSRGRRAAGEKRSG